MPNRFTRIPDGAPPNIGNHRALVGMADLFMVLMASRPASGSLAKTWVTPSSKWLSAATAVGLLAGTALALANGLGDGKPLLVVLGVALFVLAVGSGAVAWVGVLQSRAGR